MTAQELAAQIVGLLPYRPNNQQKQLIDALAIFCTTPSMQSTIFMLNGYAGTGKTSLTSALVKALELNKTKTVLLAPTGRAAKVFGNFSEHKAYTIHRYIYKVDPESGWFTSLKENKSKKGTVFIVDESSMIETVDNEVRTLNLLDDLLTFVYSGEDCRLIFLGDNAQLPPVNSDSSVSLQKALRQRNFHTLRAVLTSTARQAADSGILYNATWLRKTMMESEIPVPKISVGNFDDVKIVDGTELPDELQKSYSRYGMEQTIIITRSNSRAVDYNMAVRRVILDRTQPLSRGDIIMIAKNNYFWSRNLKGLDFIANGELAVVERILGSETFAEMDFADVEISFPDHDNVSVEVKVNMSSLMSPLPSLSQDDMRRLAVACRERVETEGGEKYNALGLLRTDPYYNALQVKYGYAVTCHKAQGGQWDSVFIDMGYVPEDNSMLDFYRWIYTAVTRASKVVHFINPVIAIE